MGTSVSVSVSQSLWDISIVHDSVHGFELVVQTPVNRFGFSRECFSNPTLAARASCGAQRTHVRADVAPVGPSSIQDPPTPEALCVYRPSSAGLPACIEGTTSEAPTEAALSSVFLFVLTLVILYALLGHHYLSVG